MYWRHSPTKIRKKKKNEASSILLSTPNRAKPLHLPPITTGTMHEIVVRRISESHAGDARKHSLTKQMLAKRAELSLERWNITTYIPWLPCDDAGVGKATERLFFTYLSMMLGILSAFTSAISLSLRHRFNTV